MRVHSLIAGLLLIAASSFGGSTAMSAEETALIKAAEKGDETGVVDLLRRGAPIDARDEARRTALLAATQGNHVGVARVLIDAGADVNAQDRQRDSAYLLAGARGYVEILRLTLVH